MHQDATATAPHLPSVLPAETLHPAVMDDGSLESRRPKARASYDYNVASTKEVVDVAHAWPA